jgi:hypothetical protein
MREGRFAVISIARLLLDRHASGAKPSPDDLDAVPRLQWVVYFDELAPFCESRVPTVPRPQRNALRVELLPSRDDRCSRRSPDGRGLAWLMSGGDPLAYGLCCRAACPRLRAALDAAKGGGA